MDSDFILSQREILTPSMEGEMALIRWEPNRELASIQTEMNRNT